MKKSSIPNLFTFANLAFGIMSILATYNENYVLSAILILLAGLVDRYDGRVARALNVSSEIGKELDSLADLVSFGVAPSILTFILYKFAELSVPYQIIGYSLVIIFPICGAYRLARYNISTFDGVFTGIPITIAGTLMAVFSIITVYAINIPIIVPIILMVAFSYLMVSTLQLKKF